MTLYAVDASFRFAATDASDPALEDWLDTVSEHLRVLETQDVSIISEGVTGDFTISLVVESNEEQLHLVVKIAMDTLRTAFHACAGSTPDWPTPGDAMSGVTITLVESSQRVLTPA